MSDIDVDDSKSEILDVGDAGSDNIGDDEVFMMFSIFTKLHDTIPGNGQTSSALRLCLLSCQI